MHFRLATRALVSALVAALLAPPAHAQYTITDLPLPRSDYLMPSGINDVGQIVGTYRPLDTGLFLGFLYSNGTLTSFSVPPLTDTFANGINDAGDIVGWYQIGDAGHIGFLYRGGVFTTIQMDDPFRRYTELFGINNAGQIIGTYTDRRDFTTHGFVYDQGSFTTIGYIPTGINDHGQIVGWRAAPVTGTLRGVLDDRGTLTLLSYAPSGINNRGQIVGNRTDAVTGARQVILDDHGVLTLLAVPDVLPGYMADINDAGQLAGLSSVRSGPGLVGVLATPVAVTATPEPATCALLGGGLLAIGGVARRRRRA